MSKTPQEQLDGIRDKIAVLQDQRDELAHAPITRDEASARFDHLLARVQADPITGNGPPGLAGGTFNEADLLQWLARPGFICETFGAEIKAGLLARFDAEAGDSTGLPMAGRRKKLSELDGEIYALEQAEEAQIELLEADGTDVARRPAADPAAQLGLAPGREAA